LLDRVNDSGSERAIWSTTNELRVLGAAYTSTLPDALDLPERVNSTHRAVVRGGTGHPSG
jgi:hypothetical protein